MLQTVGSVQQPGALSGVLISPFSQNRSLVLPLGRSKTLVSFILSCFPVAYYGKTNAALAILCFARINGLW